MTKIRKCVVCGGRGISLFVIEDKLVCDRCFLMGERLEPYKMTIENEFLGNINGVSISDKTVFYSVGFILDQLIEAGIKFNDQVIEELSLAVGRYLDKDYGSLNIMENDLVYSLATTGKLPTDRYFNIFNEVQETLDDLNQYDLSNFEGVRVND